MQLQQQTSSKENDSIDFMNYNMKYHVFALTHWTAPITDRTANRITVIKLDKNVYKRVLIYHVIRHVTQIIVCQFQVVR